MRPKKRTKARELFALTSRKVAGTYNDEENVRCAYNHYKLRELVQRVRRRRKLERRKRVERAKRVEQGKRERRSYQTDIAQSSFE